MNCTNCGEYSGHPCDERAILLDLIAELRPYESYARVIRNAIDRAEARLKGLSNE